MDLRERAKKVWKEQSRIAINGRPQDGCIDLIEAFAREMRREAFITGYKRAKADACFCLNNCDDIYIQACAERVDGS